MMAMADNVIIAMDGSRIWTYDGDAWTEVSVEDIRALGIDVEIDEDGFIRSLTASSIPYFSLGVKPHEPQ